MVILGRMSVFRNENEEIQEKNRIERDSKTDHFRIQGISFAKGKKQQCIDT